MPLWYGLAYVGQLNQKKFEVANSRAQGWEMGIIDYAIRERPWIYNLFPDDYSFSIYSLTFADDFHKHIVFYPYLKHN